MRPLARLSASKQPRFILKVKAKMYKSKKNMAIQDLVRFYA